MPMRPGSGHVGLTPDAGERGVAAYSAHRDTHFRFLKDVVVSDVIDIVRSDSRRLRYRVDRTSVVRFDTSGIDTLSRRYELVLPACWPLGALTPSPDRYLLHATIRNPGSDRALLLQFVSAVCLATHSVRCFRQLNG
jgi:sortase A